MSGRGFALPREGEIFIYPARLRRFAWSSGRPCHNVGSGLPPWGGLICWGGRKLGSSKAGGYEHGKDGDAMLWGGGELLVGPCCSETWQALPNSSPHRTAHVQGQHHSSLCQGHCAWQAHPKGAHPFFLSSSQLKPFSLLVSLFACRFTVTALGALDSSC